jgi:hypothetical protein
MQSNASSWSNPFRGRKNRRSIVNVRLYGGSLRGMTSWRDPSESKSGPDVTSEVKSGAIHEVERLESDAQGILKGT